jgi:ADP-heptose:LPS heptosyltransferase
MTTSYEEQFGPVARRIDRVRRFFSWHIKSAFHRPRIILVETRWRLGDEIMALPVYEALRTQFPGDRLMVWTNYPDLLANSPHIDAVNKPVAHTDRYILLRDDNRVDYRLRQYAVRANLTAALNRPRLDVSHWTSPLRDDLPATTGPRVAIAPGASWATKRWPAENWRELVHALEHRGAHVIELGQDGESIGAPHSFAGRTTLRDAAVLLRESDLLIAHDSGLMHLALAVGTPVVALFGPTAPECLVRDEPNFIALENRRDCAGCWNRSLDMQTPGVCPRSIDGCMNTIAVDDVFHAAETLALGTWQRCASFF